MHVCACRGGAAGEPLAQDLPDFIPSARFNGRRPGFIFSTRKRVTGYYRDGGPAAGQKRKRPQGPPGGGAAGTARHAPQPAAPAAAAEAPKQPRSKREGILGPPKTALLAGDLRGSDGGSSSEESPRRRRVRRLTCAGLPGGRN